MANNNQEQYTSEAPPVRHLQYHPVPSVDDCHDCGDPDAIDFGEVCLCVECATQRDNFNQGAWS